jgi:hypothetical protein
VPIRAARFVSNSCSLDVDMINDKCNQINIIIKAIVYNINKYAKINTLPTKKELSLS